MHFNWINRLMAFYRFGVVGEGGAVDRGDDFTPTGSDAPETDESKAAAEKLEADLKAKGAAKTDGTGADAGTGEGEGEGEGEGGEKDDKKGKKDTRLPLSRHKEILQKERELRENAERELAKLKQGAAVAVTNEKIAEAEAKLIALEEEYSKLVVDGDAAKMAAKMTEIRKLERSITEDKIHFTTQASEARAYERVQYDTTVSRLEEAYPFLNPDHDDFDQTKTAEVVALRDDFLATGKYTRAEAIQKAVKLLVPAETVRQEKAVETNVRVDKDEVAKAAAEERRKAQAKKNADTASKTPPSSKDVGLDSDKLGGRVNPRVVMSMSQEEFAKLDEEDLKRMRGDEVTT